MISKTELQLLLQQYENDFLYQDPYLYDDGIHVGYLFVFQDRFYGKLRRVVLFSNQQEAQDFLYQYWWYKKYAEQFDVHIQLNNYEEMFVTPSFVMGDKKLSVSKMKSFIMDPEEMPKEKKRKRIYGRLCRTARILVKIIEEKAKVQQDTLHNVLELQQEYTRQENEFIQLYHRYQKKGLQDSKSSSRSLKEHDFTTEISFYNQEVDRFCTLDHMESLKNFIEQLWKFLLSMECDQEYLQNKYLLFKIPIDLEDIRKKKNYLEKVFNKKKGLFGKREKVEDGLKQIEDASEIHKIVKLEDYIKNEQKRLEEKYSILDEMDYATLGDYLNEFDNLGIKIPLDSQDIPSEEEYTRAKLKELYKEIYDSLDLVEQQYLAIYHSFLQPLCDAIITEIARENYDFTKVREQYQNDITQAMQVLGDAENVFLRMKKFKQLSLRSEERFMESLVEVCKSLYRMDDFHLNGFGYVFGKSLLKEPVSVYHGTLKSIGLPIQQKGKFDVIDIFRIHPGVSVLYLPTYLKLEDPYFHDNSLEEVTGREDIALFLQKFQVKYENSVIIKVARYSSFEKYDGQQKIITGLHLEKTEMYRYISVEK